MNYPGSFGEHVNPWPPMGQPPATGPGVGNPAGWPAGPPPRSGPSGRLIGVLVLIVVTLLVIGGVAAYLLWPRADAPVKQSALSGLLLTRQEAGEILGTPMVGDSRYGDEIFEAMKDEAREMVDQACVIGAPDDVIAHDGSGWTDVRVQYLQAAVKDADADPDVHLLQSVVAYPDSEAAARYVSSTKAKWEGCANRTVNQQDKDATDDSDDLWKNGAVSEHDGMVIWPVSEVSTGWICTDLMVARANLVIEVEGCGTADKTSPTQAVGAKIIEKIDGAPRQD